MATTIVDVGYRSTHYWVISSGRSRLLFDIGWPGTMGTMRSMLRRRDVPIEEIRCAVASHYHIDHAGLAQEMKDAGVPLLVLDVQLAAIPLMARFTKPHDHYVAVSLEDTVTISCRESRATLARLGIPGEILHTPGHSPDGVTLLLDSGEAFTGDLPPEDTAFDDPVALADWRRLRELGAVTVYPAHGPVRPIGRAAPP